jgi:hypothetical protein
LRGRATRQKIKFFPFFKIKQYLFIRYLRKNIYNNRLRK